MQEVHSRARVVWEGNLVAGQGTLDLESGVIAGHPVSWAARANRLSGKTSPEELIAGAHASCYAMALSNALAKRGTPPIRLDVTAQCTLAQVDGTSRITTVAIEVRGQVDGLAQADFEAVAREAEQGCPVSNALRNNVAIRVTALLERAAGR